MLTVVGRASSLVLLFFFFSFNKRIPLKHDRVQENKVGMQRGISKFNSFPWTAFSISLGILRNVGGCWPI